MLFIQLTGLSGAGKTTIASLAAASLNNQGHPTKVIDGDVYRQTLCRDLGFSKADRQENIRRLSAVAAETAASGTIAILSAINPYEDTRCWVEANHQAYTVWISCPLDVLMQRDTKGLYKRAMLPDEDPLKIHNLTGVDDPYEIPVQPALMLSTHLESSTDSATRLVVFILQQIKVLGR
ncbi:adenylyl-sulfate kinase [Chitinophaga sp. Hz27]|uniref:adenylyl-sulfate kinase n=1 Tax=Chitinophaga sp. Hz27 TaxID=3347169 RepID=UPI0035E39CB9